MKDIAIIGGGLAGTACAHILRRAGLRPVIYEASDALANGASGNDLGMYNPRLAAERSPEAEYFIYAFERALEEFSSLEDIDFNPCGALHLITDEKRAIRYNKMAKSWGWGEDDLRLLNANEASEVAGVALEYDALYLPRSGSVSPRKICAAYAEGIEIHYNHKVDALSDIEADAVIITSAMGSASFDETSWLDLRAVRGQVTYTEATPYSSNLKTALCYGGYCTPRPQGGHVVGATFQRWLDHSEIIEQDDADNLARLAEFVPKMAEGMRVSGHRASVRTTSRDHFPVVGRVPVHEDLYISTAHGSHGILSSIAAAHLLRDMITGQAPSLSQDVIERLSPERYYDVQS